MVQQKHPIHMPESLPQALVVSTHSTKIAIIKRALKGIYAVIGSETGISALSWLTDEPFNLIILDQKTLSSEWLSLSTQIRTLPGYNRIPILLISSNHKKSFYIEALNHGITDLINEPLDASEVSQRVTLATQTQPLEQKVNLVRKKFNQEKAPPPIQPALNKRVIMTEPLLKKISKIFRTQSPLCLLMLEISQWGKMSLREKGELGPQIEDFLQKQTRAQDLVLPQEESRFLILLPKTSCRAGTLIGETLKADAEKRAFRLKEEDLFLKFSLGCAAYDPKSPLKETPYEQFETLVTKVERSLKKAHRNPK